MIKFHPAYLALLVSGLLFAPQGARAQGPPIQTDTAIMLGLEGRGVRTFLKVTRKDKLLQDGDEITDPMGQSATIFVYPIAVPYNLSHTFQVGGVVPFLTKDLESVTGNKTGSGLGDVTLFVKKLLVQVDRKQETFRVAVKGSAKLPTGDSGGDVPLGSGSFDYGASAVATWVKLRWGLYGETIYFHNTSDDEIDYGDRFGYNAAVGFRLIPGVYTRYPQPILSLYLELNGSVVGHTRRNDVENPDSGGSLLFLSPGIQYVGGRRWLVEASVQVPVIDEPNGTQLGTDWTASLGTRVLIF